MSRRAILPTGQAIEFPDETPDHEIHAHVRAQMGLPPPHQVDGPAALAALAETRQAFGELSQHLATVIQTMQETVRQMAQTVQQFGQAAHSIAGTVENGAQRVAQSVAIGTDKMIHASSQAVGLVATSANSVHEAVRRVEAIGPRIEGSIDSLVKEIRRPKRAVKSADGSWHSEPANG